MQYDSDYNVRLATLEALGGDTTKTYDSVYDIDLEILSLTAQNISNFPKLVSLTQQEYTDLQVKDPSTFYYITDASNNA